MRYGGLDKQPSAVVEKTQSKIMHPETVEVYDRKERSFGIIRKRETQSVSFVRESIGVTHAKSLTQKKQEDSSSKKRNCVSTVAAQDTGGNNVEAEDVSSASQSII